MTPVRHRVSGAELSFKLADEMEVVREELRSPSGRVARTLVKLGPLRVTLVGIGAGGALSEHSSPGPVTIHVLEGAIEVVTRENNWSLAAGELLMLDGGVAHAVDSASGSFFLLTVATPASDLPPTA